VIFGIVFLSSMLLGSGMYSTNQIFAQNENEAEIEADIEQENKCKNDTECENENEINNKLNITTITGAGTGDSNGNGEDGCAICFTTEPDGPWQQNQLGNFIDYIDENPIQYEEGSVQLSTIDEICEYLENSEEPVDFGPIAEAIDNANLGNDDNLINQVLECLNGLVFILE